ncbi:hypothetical protein QJS10_CPB20g01762 [Acorus calamus]|uniref:Uncharacterized protein n=1 Tax=Acorus calamus TaxID=4465 RepID=A0AAV9C9Q0_ACOCL|nr:hypothetical protein QJS10_CPB20g01762 [Acorus calamus]
MENSHSLLRLACIISVAFFALSAHPVSGGGGRSLTVDDRKGRKCVAGPNSVCSKLNVMGGNGKEALLLDCCGGWCRDIISDQTNCGSCRNRCRYGQLCCRGKCTVVAYDVDNCGECSFKCHPGIRCTYGTCGYA